MLAARAQAHGPVLYISPTTTTNPPRCRAQPRSSPSRRRSRSRISSPMPAAQGIQDQLEKGQSSRAATAMTRPAAPRRDRVSRRQLNGGGGGSVDAPGPTAGTAAAGPRGAGGGTGGRVAGSHGGVES